MDDPPVDFLAATPARLDWMDFLWIAFSAGVFGFVGKHVFREGGDKVDVSKYGSVEVGLALMVGAVFGGFGYLQFATKRVPTEKIEFTLTALAISSALTLVFAMVVLLILKSWGRNLHEHFGLDRQPLWRTFVTALVLLFAAYPIIGLGTLLTQQFSTGPDDLQELVRYFRAPGDRATRVFIIVSAIVIAPACEELFFRGLLHGVIKRYGGLSVGIVVNSALFALIHGNLPSAGPLFALAVCLTLAYEFTGTLYVPIAMHSCFNATQLVQMLIDSPAAKPYS